MDRIHLRYWAARVSFERKYKYSSILWQRVYVSTTFCTLTDCYTQKQLMLNGPIDIGFHEILQYLQQRK